MTSLFENYVSTHYANILKYWCSEFSNHFPARYKNNKMRRGDANQLPPFDLQILNCYQCFANCFSEFKINIPWTLANYIKICKINSIRYLWYQPVNKSRHQVGHSLTTLDPSSLAVVAEQPYSSSKRLVYGITYTYCRYKFSTIYYWIAFYSLTVDAVFYQNRILVHKRAINFLVIAGVMEFDRKLK